MTWRKNTNKPRVRCNLYNTCNFHSTNTKPTLGMIYLLILTCAEYKTCVLGFEIIGR